MATQSKKLVVILALFLALAVVLRGANGSDTTFTLCRMTKDGLKSCQESVDKLNPLPPSEACCAAISMADLQCLCFLKDSQLLKIFNVDPEQAMALPRKCNPDRPFFHCQ